MVTWAQFLTDRSRQWCPFVRIQGYGPYLSNGDLTAADDDARYRFCIATPDHAASQPASIWLEYMSMPLPDLLAEQGPTHGGVATYGGVTINILDNQDVLTGLFATDTPPVTVLSEDLDTAETAVDVGSVSSISTTDVVWVNDEAMRVTGIAGTTLTVTRGYLGTTAAVHTSGDPVYTSSPFLIGRELEFTVCPLNSSSLSDEQELGRFVIDGYSWDDEMNVWSIKASTVLVYLDRIVPIEPREFEILGPLGDGPASGQVDIDYLPIDNTDPAEVDAWIHWPLISGDHWPPIDCFGLVVQTGEILGLRTTAGISGFFVSRRGVLGTEIEDIEAGQTLRQVFIAGDPLDDLPGSFRSLDPGDETMDVDPSTRGCHFVDIMLNILTSPIDDNGAYRQAENHDGVHRNYSTLPPGYGAGMPANLIDWDSWLDVRRRTPQFVFPNFVLGRDKEAISTAEIFTANFLEPLGVFLTVDNGLVRMSMLKSPAPDEEVTSWDHDDILVDRDREGVLKPRFRPAVTTRNQVGAIKYTLADEDFGGIGEATVHSSNYFKTYGRRGVYGGAKPLGFEVPGAPAHAADLFASRAISKLNRTNRPRVDVEADVDIASAWSTPYGSQVLATISEVPDLAGGRGWTNMPVFIDQREHFFGDQDGLYSKIRGTALGLQYAARRIAPAAFITGVVGAVATVSANRYTSSDAPAGMPNQDCNAFAVGDVVILKNRDGTSAGGTRTVVAITPGSNTIELSSSTGLAANVIIVCADYGNALTSQQDRYAFEADTTTQTLGATTDPALQWGDE